MFAFDLISDIHVDTWPALDFTGLATSPVLVVAGDVSSDPTEVKQTLEHLSSCYQAVFFIDGNTEHSSDWNQLDQSYKNISDCVSDIKHVVYLQNKVVIINGVAILGTNGWWTWDFNTNVGPKDSQSWFVDHESCSGHVPKTIDVLAHSDVDYLVNSVLRLQKHADVKHIVVVTHTVPRADLLLHDLNLMSSHLINLMGNSGMQQVLLADTERKISHWCFGHYHTGVDQIINGVRYISNCKGRKNTPHGHAVYFPLRIEVGH